MFASVFSTLLAILAVGVFFWLLTPSRSANQSKTSNTPSDDNRSSQFGVTSGLLGGTVEDAAIAKFAVGRANGDAADNRDVAAGASMQVSAKPPE